MRRLWLIFCQAVTVSLAVLFVVTTLKPGWFTKQPTLAQFVPVLEAVPEATQSAPVSAAQSSYAGAAAKALPSVVHIFTSKEIKAARNPFADDPLFRHFFGDRGDSATQRRASGLGSGVIASNSGYILTNNHVVEQADEIEVALYDGRKLPAKIVGRDPETDLAVLHIAADKLPAITFGAAETLQVGDVVLAIGNPFGVGQTVTMGIVSALGRSQLGISTFENFIQTDAAINPGNSGGALVDARGNLVGINSAIYSRSGGSLGIGFAIPASLTRNVMEQIIQTGSVTRGWIGVEVRELSAEQAQTLGLPAQAGTLITGIVNGAPADKAGIEPGDLLVAINGKPVGSPPRMLEAIAGLTPGAEASLSLMRGSKAIEQKIVIGRRPAVTSSE
ncbi:Do family serine endopeptidase [Niveibacterium sp. 24ML]|uniref:Do family serine endopeptidase n=1 Tax=Niveibacterium sp. 24ML TaxID=2985512 RepID=UPI00226F215B|nr:Do family serine endopeptidase [Niveibacterium sp. 24ML]MCX9154870.1 Do family serine endopeptidase [Niveibacterium sp. 24ML]